MIRLITVLFFAMFASMAQANELQDADKAWAPGKPWPAHWGLITYPYKEGWNTVLMGYVRKVYDQGEAGDTLLKDIPYAHQKNASVEICMMKRGLLKLATICNAALVESDLVGTLKEDDIVAFFYPNHSTGAFSKGPGAKPLEAIRVFQKITSAGDESCWERRVMLFYGPVAQACFNKIDTARVESMLTRDFGPRSGLADASQQLSTVQPDASNSDSNMSAPLTTSEKTENQ